MSRGRGRWFACPTVFGTIQPKPHRDWTPVPVEVVCGYQGRPERAARPRPSTKPVLICPSCLMEVK